MWKFPVDEGLVLVRPDVHGIFLLNASARLLWNELEAGASVNDVGKVFADHFGISLEIAHRDIEATMASWDLALLSPPSPVAFPSNVIPATADCRVDCVVNGTPLRVLLESGDVWDEIAPRLEPLRAESVSPQHTFTVASADGRVYVLRDGTCIGSEEITAAARAILLQAMAFLEEPAAILHAGGCGGILLAGHSHSGKSTLCAALMARGLPYHCDDSAVLDQEFRVAPMPFPVMLRQGSWALLDGRLPGLKEAPVYTRWGTDVRFLNPAHTTVPSTVTALVFVSHAAGAETQLAQISVFDSLLALQRSGFWVEHTREGIERFLTWLASIRRYTLQYAELDEAERVIGALAASSYPSQLT